MPLVKGIQQVRNAQDQCVGVTVHWSDPDKGSQTFSVTDLPNNLTTAAGVENYFNALVGTLNGHPQTRLGVFFGTFAWARVWSFQKDVFCEFSMVISDDPITSSPWA